MLSTALRIFVSVLFLGIFAFTLRDEIPAIITALSNVHITPLVMGAVIMLITTILLGVRFKLVLEAQGLNVSLKDAVHLSFIGVFFNNFLPTSVGGDLVKGYCTAKQTNDMLKSYSSILMDRILGLAVFIAVPSVTVLFVAKDLDPRVPKIVFTALALAAILLLVLFNKDRFGNMGGLGSKINKLPFGKTLNDLYTAMYETTRNKKLILGACAVSVLIQLSGIVAIYCIVLALSGSVPISYLLMFVPIVHLFSMLPSLGGLGLRETGFKSVFSIYLGVAGAGALAVLYLAFMILNSLIGGIIYSMRHDYHFDFKAVKKVSV